MKKMNFFKVFFVAILGLITIFGLHVINFLVSGVDSYDNITKYLTSDGSIDSEVIDNIQGVEVTDEYLSKAMMMSFNTYNSSSDSGSYSGKYTVSYDNGTLESNWNDISDYFSYSKTSLYGILLEEYTYYDNGKLYDKVIYEYGTTTEIIEQYRLYTDQEMIYILNENDEWVAYSDSSMGDYSYEVELSYEFSEPVYDEITQMYTCTLTSKYEGSMTVDGEYYDFSYSPVINFTYKFLTDDTIYMICDYETYGINFTIECLLVLQNQTVRLPDYSWA